MDKIKILKIEPCTYFFDIYNLKNAVMPYLKPISKIF